MTFDARVSTVDAIECVRLGSLVRLAWSLFSGGFQVSLRFRRRMQQNQKPNTSRRIPTTPPNTPPTMAPTGVDCFASTFWPGNEPIFTQLVEAHALQDCGVREQVSSALQFGQLGLSFGSHSTHRRNNVVRASRAEANLSVAITKNIPHLLTSCILSHGSIPI